MKLTDRINAFEKLGEHLSAFLSNHAKKEKLDNDIILNKVNIAVERSENLNPWFTRENSLISIENISKQLTKDNLSDWLRKYDLPEKNKNPKKIGVILAGNIPLVGFHDFICVLITGNIFIGKQSSKDNILLKCLADILIVINPDFSKFIVFEDNILKGFDAVIATGSNNSSMYFESYFKNVPNIIRKNRNSIAILNGNETPEEIKKLGDDIFTYFGLGCRNISKIYVPDKYEIKKIFDSLESFSTLLNHNKYANNYTYNQTLYLMKGVKFFDNGFALMIEDENNISSPISVIYYEYYKNIRKLYEILESRSSQIQCVATNINGFDNSVRLGNTQKTELWDYADNIDTIKFLYSLI